jgi:hypothetical protein
MLELDGKLVDNTIDFDDISIQLVDFWKSAAKKFRILYTKENIN